jgi:hypothetical protein
VSCKTIARLLAFFVGDDLPPRRARAVRAHLRDCFACARRFAAWREPFVALREEGTRTPDPPRDLWEGLRSRIADAAPLRGRRWGSTLPRVSAAAILLVGLLVAAASWIGHERPVEVSNPSSRRAAGEKEASAPILPVGSSSVPNPGPWGALRAEDGSFPSSLDAGSLLYYYGEPFLPWISTIPTSFGGPVPIQPVVLRPGSREF